MVKLLSITHQRARHLNQHSEKTNQSSTSRCSTPVTTPPCKERGLHATDRRNVPAETVSRGLRPSPRSRTFTAALWSRSSTTPQCTQICVRTLRSLCGPSFPQALQIWLVLYGSTS